MNGSSLFNELVCPMHIHYFIIQGGSFSVILIVHFLVRNMILTDS